MNEPDIIQDSVPHANNLDDYGTNFKKLRITDNVRELQTVLRDKATSRGDFIFYADRLIRLVVEEGLNQLPYQHCDVTTPTGHEYHGLSYQRGNCGVSIMRSGEAMEQGLRDCCRSIRIGKILIQKDEETREAKVVYAKLPPDIDQRKVLLMYPIMNSGNTVIRAVQVLKDHYVKEENIILLNLFVTPQGSGERYRLLGASSSISVYIESAAQALVKTFPYMKVLTSEVHPVTPTHFGMKYFGTD